MKSSFLIKEGLANIRKNGAKSISTLFVICATMLILALFILVLQNVNNFVNIVEEEQGLQAFIDDKITTESKINAIKEQVEKINGVKTVVYLDKAAAFEDAKKVLGEQDYLLDGLEKADIFPASFVVKINNLKEGANIQKKIEAIDGIYKVRYSEVTIQSVMTISKVANIVLLTIGFIMLVISIFIISNTIKLAVYSNKREIFIMRYIGATNKFITTPYVIEGVFLGVLGSFISWIIISLVYIMLYAKLPQVASALGTYGLMPYSKLWYIVLGFNLLLGLVIGYLGSKFSVKKYLKA